MNGMSKFTSITLIRHGETEWNLSGRWQGHADSLLSSRGISQAKALGERIKTEEFDFFYDLVFQSLNAIVFGGCLSVSKVFHFL